MVESNLFILHDISFLFIKYTSDIPPCALSVSSNYRLLQGDRCLVLNREVIRKSVTGSDYCDRGSHGSVGLLNTCHCTGCGRNVAVEWLAFLFRVREVPGSNRPGDTLCSLKFFMVFLCLFRKMPRYYLVLVEGHIISYPLQFIIHYSSYHSMVATDSVVK
jgi:hypothetical protein